MESILDVEVMDKKGERSVRWMAVYHGMKADFQQLIDCAPERLTFMIHFRSGYSQPDHPLLGFCGQGGRKVQALWAKDDFLGEDPVGRQFAHLF